MSREILDILSILKNFEVSIIFITSNKNSKLSKNSDICLFMPILK